MSDDVGRIGVICGRGVGVDLVLMLCGVGDEAG